MIKKNYIQLFILLMISFFIFFSCSKTIEVENRDNHTIYLVFLEQTLDEYADSGSETSLQQFYDHEKDILEPNNSINYKYSSYCFVFYWNFPPINVVECTHRVSLCLCAMRPRVFVLSPGDVSRLG